MPPLSEKSDSMLSTRGIAAPLIIIIIAAFGLGLAGSVVYPKIKIQIEQLISKLTPLPEERQDSESQQTEERAETEEKLSDNGEQDQQEVMEESEPDQQDEGKPEPKQTGQKDIAEEGKIEGVEDDLPADLTFKVLD